MNQLPEDADGRIVIEAYARNARTPTTATLAQVRDDKDCLLGEDKRDPVRFRLVLTHEMGQARKSAQRSIGFIDSVLRLLTEFYGTVVQNLTPWTPKAPQITRPTAAPEPDALPSDNSTTSPTIRDGERRPILGGFALPPVTQAGAASAYAPAAVLEDPDSDTAGPVLSSEA